MTSIWPWHPNAIRSPGRPATDAAVGVRASGMPAKGSNLGVKPGDPDPGIQTWGSRPGGPNLGLGSSSRFVSDMGVAARQQCSPEDFLSDASGPKPQACGQAFPDQSIRVGSAASATRATTGHRDQAARNASPDSASWDTDFGAHSELKMRPFACHRPASARYSPPCADQRSGFPGSLIVSLNH
jgi:hypothetical protein